MRSSRVFLVMAALALATAMSVLPTQVASAQPPSTAVLVPTNNAIVSGTQVVLDASASPGVTQVQFELTGATLTDSVIATATPTEYGWIASWNSTTAANGTYSLQSVATDGGSIATSTGISMTLKNPPTMNVLVPNNGATLSGSTYLDASATNATSVEFLLFGGSYGYAAPVLCSATPTLYGWLCPWNTLTVPDTTYALVSEASNAAGNAFSSVGVTLNNPAVSFGGPVVFTYPSQAVGLSLSPPSTSTVQVDYTTLDGPSAALYWGAWTGAASSFSPSSGTVTFAPGQTTATIPFSVNPTNVDGCSIYYTGQNICYPSVTVTLTNPTNAVLGTSTATNVFYAPL